MEPGLVRQNDSQGGDLKSFLEGDAWTRIIIRNVGGSCKGCSTLETATLHGPGIGEIIGGSRREERLDVLETRITELGLPLEL